MLKPLCIDLCCGIGGWAKGFMAAGYRVVGFDIRTFKRHPYPGDLVLQDVRTLGGRQFRDAACIVASPPCEEFSRKALPFHRDKPDPDLGIVLFKTCQRIIRDAGIPGVIENVRNAQRWMGRADAHFGSFYLWGEVPWFRPRMDLRKGFQHGIVRPPWIPHNKYGSALMATVPFGLAFWLATEWRRTGAIEDF